jgi:hypothetical protein
VLIQVSDVAPAPPTFLLFFKKEIFFCFAIGVVQNLPERRRKTEKNKEIHVA